MLIALMRHGKAEAPGHIPDRDRRLTEGGKIQVEEVARLLPFRPSTIYSSPLRRALETADIVASIYGVKVEVTRELEPGILSMESLKRLNPGDKALLIGHAPSIELVLTSLIGGGSIKMKAASIAILEAEDLEYSSATLIALLIPPSIKL